jgi:hypothetical protein
MDQAEPPVIRAEAPEIEAGAGAFLLEGGAVGGYTGVTPFLIDELNENVSLRPSLVLGTSVPGARSSMLAAARFDTCARVPGNYVHGGGIQLDLCGGLDAGFSYVPAGTDPWAPASGVTIPYVDLGPSAGLRAEVGRLAVMLRVVGGISVTRSGYTDRAGEAVDPPLGTLRLELDFSWLVHTASGS